MTSKMIQLSELQSELSGETPRKILKKAFTLFDNISISFSGADDVVLIDMAVNITDNVQVFTLDTGRLHPETYQFIDRIRDHYQVTIEVLYPNADNIAKLVKAKGLFSFYRDGHRECCGIRKVEPLHRKLLTLDAWITGQRKDQSPETRQDLVEVESDRSIPTSGFELVKFNPLVNWSSKQVWDYIKAYKVPFNELHSRGFRSIGCEPCTRPTLPNQPEREGRWWWESSNKKECGLHPRNLKD